LGIFGILGILVTKIPKIPKNPNLRKKNLETPSSLYYV
jgi:hypothetical protein